MIAKIDHNSSTRVLIPQPDLVDEITTDIDFCRDIPQARGLHIQYNSVGFLQHEGRELSDRTIASY